MCRAIKGIIKAYISFKLTLFVECIDMFKLTIFVKNRSNGPELIGLLRRCIRLYIGKQQNKEAGYLTNGVTMFYL